MDTLGSRIREYRKRKGLTQRQLAKLIGVKHNSISDWENNKNKPYADTLENLLWALDVDANTLLGWDNPEQIKADAEELTDKILSDPKIKDLLLALNNLQEGDTDLVINFIKRLSSK